MNDAPRTHATHALAPGVRACAPGVLFLENSRTLVAADAHLAYEEVIGGALPVWSAGEIARRLLQAARRLDAREIVLLGDVIHASAMSDGAAHAVRSALDALRAYCTLTLLAGNHEGRSRGAAVLGPTLEATVRDGWLLVHGDGEPQPGRHTIVGHLHPSLHLTGGASVPAFLAGERLIVVPALTPYSSGLDVRSAQCRRALRVWGVAEGDAYVVAAADERVYAFGTLAALKRALARPAGSLPARRSRRRLLRPD